MQIAMVGLGKMGANMTMRLLRGGHQVVAYDLNEAAIQAAETQGAEGVRTLADVVAGLQAPRVIWVMVPATRPSRRSIPWRNCSRRTTSLSMGETVTTKIPFGVARG